MLLSRTVVTPEIRASLLAPLCHYCQGGDVISLFETSEARVLVRHETTHGHDPAFIQWKAGNVNVSPGTSDGETVTVTASDGGLRDGLRIPIPAA